MRPKRQLVPIIRLSLQLRDRRDQPFLLLDARLRRRLASLSPFFCWMFAAARARRRTPGALTRGADAGARRCGVRRLAGRPPERRAPARASPGVFGGGSRDAPGRGGDGPGALRGAGSGAGDARLGRCRSETSSGQTSPPRPRSDFRSASPLLLQASPTGGINAVWVMPEEADPALPNPERDPLPPSLSLRRGRRSTPPCSAPLRSQAVLLTGLCCVFCLSVD